MSAALPSPALALLLTLAGCSQGFSDGDGTDGGATDGGAADGGDGGGDGGVGSGTVADDLPDVDQGLDPGGCDELQDEPVAGAAVYFLGTYVRVDGEEWLGEEEYRLYANESWRALGAEDCSVWWSVTATETAAGSCATCELGLAVTASLDAGRTNCDPALYQGDETFSTTYGVELRDDDTATRWFFASSGEQFASGYAAGDVDDGGEAAINFVTERTCQWFGSGE